MGWERGVVYQESKSVPKKVRGVVTPLTGCSRVNSGAECYF